MSGWSWMFRRGKLMMPPITRAMNIITTGTGLRIDHVTKFTGSPLRGFAGDGHGVAILQEARAAHGDDVTGGDAAGHLELVAVHASLLDAPPLHDVAFLHDEHVAVAVLHHHAGDGHQQAVAA